MTYGTAKTEYKTYRGLVVDIDDVLAQLDDREEVINISVYHDSLTARFLIATRTRIQPPLALHPARQGGRFEE